MYGERAACCQARHDWGNRAHKHKLCILMAYKAGFKCRGLQLCASDSGSTLQHLMKVASAVLVPLLPLTVFSLPPHRRPPPRT